MIRGLKLTGSKKKLTRSLIFYDLVAFLLIFFLIVALFEVIIKRQLVNYNLEKLQNNIDTLLVDVNNATSSLESKSVLPYRQSLTMILDNLILTALKRSRYDDSVVAILAPDSEGRNRILTKNSVKSGKAHPELTLRRMMGVIYSLPPEIPVKTYDEIFKLSGKEGISAAQKSAFFTVYQLDKTGSRYLLTEKQILPDTLTVIKKLIGRKFHRITADRNSIQFQYNGVQYIGQYGFFNQGLRSGDDRNLPRDLYPLVIVADRVSDFYYLINIIRNVFILWVLFILMISAVIKFRATSRATRQINLISSMIKDESTNIRTRGIIGEALKEIESEFVEVDVLNDSSISLNSSLNELKKVVQGVTNEEFFIGTITGDKTITEQHYAFMSVMFLDIKGFTGISEKHKDHAMKIGITIFSEVGKILKKYGGQIRKLLGDAALITFKDKNDEGQTSLSAFLASVEALNLVRSIEDRLNEQYNPEHLEEKQIHFNFRIGLDCGIVSEGLYGTEDNFEYGIIGDPVNTASRFEALNKQYQTHVLMTDNIYAAINRDILAKHPSDEMTDPDEILKKYYSVSRLRVDRGRPKGKENPNDMFTVLFYEDQYPRFLGTSQLYSEDCFKVYEKILNNFIDSIRFWQDYYHSKGSEKIEKKMTAAKRWANISKVFAMYYHKYRFGVADQVLRLILKYEEYNECMKNYQEWTKRNDIQVKEPDSDWLENPYGCRELDK